MNRTGGKDEKRADYTALIESLLAPYSAWKAGDGRWRSACPVHKGDNATSFSVFSNGRWHCFRCKASGDMARLVMVIKHLTLQQAHDFVGTAPVPLLNIEALPQLPDWKNRARKDQYPTLSEAVLGPYRKFCAEYLLGRGFSKASLKFYEIGYDLQNCKIIIPVRDVRGKLVGITERLDFDHDKFQMSKYRHSEFQKALHLYGMQKWAGKEIDALYLVEGQLDVVRMYQLGKHAVAVMGDNLSAEQTDVLVRHAQVNRLVLAFDNDEAGQVVTLSAARRLHKTRFGPKLAVMEYDTKDPGELTDRSKTRVVSIHSTKLLMTPASNSVRLFHPHH